jgi:hypothetical protein
VHDALAVKSSGVPLVMLSQSIWAHHAAFGQQRQEKIERLQAMRAIHTHVLPRSQLILVSDRESDFQELLAAAKPGGAHALTRALPHAFIG